MSAKANETKKQAKNDNQDLFADTNVTMKTGHLVKDPESVADGKFMKFRIASNKQYLNDDGIKTLTNYFNVMVSKNLTDAFEIASSFKKGDWVYTKGEDSTKSFDTPQGYKQTASTIFAYEVFLKKSKADEQSSSGTKAASTQKEPKPAMG